MKCHSPLAINFFDLSTLFCTAFVASCLMMNWYVKVPRRHRGSTASFHEEDDGVSF